MKIQAGTKFTTAENVLVEVLNVDITLRAIGVPTVNVTYRYQFQNTGATGVETTTLNEFIRNVGPLSSLKEVK